MGGKTLGSETQEETQEEETQDTQMLDFPSAAQPPAAPTQRNAFDIMLESAKAPPPTPPAVKSKSHRGKNEFVQDEADLSDEEDMLGGGSGDEDENGLDKELEEIIDNEEVERELREQQDALALQRYACATFFTSLPLGPLN